ncbi:uncharacterized protein F5891DRAFT_986636 [Suillus fuscotomentosus]|uniref:Uncharacterized protein n=1 Tax=Suillus fuscotomentosus TaxID=1912939 RepID=A0AAD4DRR8_9AGAM|nr:uncharacterized protein F5891DRAFT_986636 [Suillus fuscotomentosus]KAG1891706.1 hypothetical protein F5891DRAFT_986636 [Suillus fuscotomentosus]
MSKLLSALTNPDELPEILTIHPLTFAWDAYNGHCHEAHPWHAQWTLFAPMQLALVILTRLHPQDIVTCDSETEGLQKCPGCRKVFLSQKRLSGHEAQCEADKLLDADVYKSQCHLEKGHKKHRKMRARDETRSPEHRQRNTSPEADMQMDLGDDHVNTEYGDIAGPLGYIPELEPPVPTPDTPAVVSAHSGQQIRMPARYIDYIPGSSTHLTHMPPMNHQEHG